MSNAAPAIEKLGVIAGSGALPQKLLYACERSGIETFVVGFEHQTSSDVFKGRRYMKTRLGAAGRIIKTLKAQDIRDLVLIGAIKRPSLVELKPDLRTIQFFARIGLRALGDDGLLKALRTELEGEGFKIHAVQSFVSDLLMSKGALGQMKPKKEHWPDIERGIEIAHAIGALDIGQSVVVQQGIVLGVEAIEGTDQLLRRCKGYMRPGRGGVLVKLCKPQQDVSLDLPTIGPETIQHCIDNNLEGVAVAAGKTLVIEPQVMVEMADKHKIFIYGLDETERSS